MKNDINTSIYILDFNFSIPKDLKNNFQGIFSYIKKKFQIKFSRKSHIDSLLKKAKGKFFKTIHEIMNLSLNIIVKRLPQKFITNITIEYNQKYLKKNIIQLYQEFNLLPDYTTLEEKGFIKSNRIQNFKQFCSYNLINLYDIYLQSQKYFDGIVYEPEEFKESIDEELINLVLQTKDKVTNQMDNMRVADAIDSIFEIFRRCNN